MIRVAFLLIVLFALVALGIYLVTRLIVFWRDRLRQWKLEKEEHERKKLKEAEEEFIKSTQILNESFENKE